MGWVIALVWACTKDYAVKSAAAMMAAPRFTIAIIVLWNSACGSAHTTTWNLRQRTHAPLSRACHIRKVAA
jgi:hypothetical protein